MRDLLPATATTSASGFGGGTGDASRRPRMLARGGSVARQRTGETRPERVRRPRRRRDEGGRRRPGCSGDAADRPAIDATDAAGADGCHADAGGALHRPQLAAEDRGDRPATLLYAGFVVSRDQLEVPGPIPIAPVGLTERPHAAERAADRDPDRLRRAIRRWAG
jgi:hypothetical protein